jgi:tRNA threonylcarbamoyladenosine biosynthesis protein TsaE
MGSLREDNVERDTLILVSHSVAETQRLGCSLGQLLEGQEVICLEGELGTGKTTLTQAIGCALGVDDPITSPTFTLVNEYRGKRATLRHIDLYRLDTTEEMVQAGIDAYLCADGICVIEWAEKAKEILPPEYLYITLKHADDDWRGITLQSEGQRYLDLLRRLRKALGS